MHWFDLVTYFRFDVSMDISFTTAIVSFLHSNIVMYLVLYNFVLSKLLNTLHKIYTIVYVQPPQHCA